MHGADRLLSSDGGGKLTEHNESVNRIDLTVLAQTGFMGADRVIKRNSIRYFCMDRTREYCRDEP